MFGFCDDVEIIKVVETLNQNVVFLCKNKKNLFGK